MAEQLHTQTTTRPLNSISFAEWEACEDPSEIVNGEIIMSPVRFEHALIARFVLFTLYEYLKNNPLGDVFPDNTPYVLDGDEREDWVRGSRIPDVSFVSKERMEAHRKTYGDKPNYLHLSPDLAVEIVSQNDRYSDITSKVAEYLEQGTRLVWVIDPQTRKIKVHTPQNPDGRSLQEDETLSGDPLFPGLELPVKAIFDA